MRSLFVLAAVCTLGFGQEPRPGERPTLPPPTQRPGEPLPRHLAPSAELSQVARQLLRERMVRHGKTMTDLVQAVIVLDYAATARLAAEIAEEPRLARPLSPNDLNASVPDKFFELQDELHQRASTLSEV